MVNPRARRTSIGSMLNAKLSRPQLKAQAATLPPQLPPTRDWLRRNPLKRQRSPDREKPKPAPNRAGLPPSAQNARKENNAWGMRSSSVRRLLVYCADYRGAHAIRISGERWPNEIRLSD